MIYRKDIKLMAFVASAMFWGSGYAADNSIYIDQSGDSGTYTITQDGSGNKVKGIGTTAGSAGTDGTPAKFSGNGQTVNIEQTGQNNVLSIGATTTQGGSLAGYQNIGVNINYQVTGGNNTGIIDINNNNRGTSIGSVVSIVQDGGATAKLKMTGSENKFTVNTAGGAGNVVDATIDASNVVATVNQTSGGGNETTLNLTGNKGQVSITSVGAANITSVTQSASGVTGAQTIIDITGSGNETTVTQSGSYDHYASIKLNSGSNDNVIAIAQSGGAGTGHSATLELLAGSSSNTIGLTQQGSVANLTNLKLSGSNNTYTILQKN